MMQGRFRVAFLLGVMAVFMPICSASISDTLTSLVADIANPQTTQASLMSDFGLLSSQIYTNSLLSADAAVATGLAKLGQDLGASAVQSVLQQDVTSLQSAINARLAAIAQIPTVTAQLAKQPCPYQMVYGIVTSREGTSTVTRFIPCYRVPYLTGTTTTYAYVPVTSDNSASLKNALGSAYAAKLPAGAQPVFLRSAAGFSVDVLASVGATPSPAGVALAEDDVTVMPDGATAVGNIVGVSWYLADPRVVMALAATPCPYQKVFGVLKSTQNGVADVYVSFYRLNWMQLNGQSFGATLVPVADGDNRVLNQALGLGVDNTPILFLGNTTFSVDSFARIANCPSATLPDLTDDVSAFTPSSGVPGTIASMNLYLDDPRISAYITQNPCPYPEVFGTLDVQAPTPTGGTAPAPTKSCVRFYRVAYANLAGDLSYAYVPVSPSDIKAFAAATGNAVQGSFGADNQQILFVDSNGFSINTLGVISSTMYHQTPGLAADLKSTTRRGSGNITTVSLSTTNPYLMTQGQSFPKSTSGKTVKVYVPSTPYLELKNPTHPGAVSGAVTLDLKALGTPIDVSLQGIKSFKKLGFYASTDSSKTPVYFATYYYPQTVSCVDSSGAEILVNTTPLTISMYLGMVFNEDQNVWVDVSGLGFTKDGKKRAITGAQAAEIMCPAFAVDGKTPYAYRYLVGFDADNAGVTSKVYGDVFLSVTSDVPQLKPLLDVDTNILSLTGANVLRLTTVEQSKVTTFNDAYVSNENLNCPSEMLTSNGGLLYAVPAGVENPAVLDAYGVTIPADPNVGKPVQNVVLNFFKKTEIGVTSAALVKKQVPLSAILQTYPQQTTSSKQEAVQLYVEHANHDVFSEVFFAPQVTLCPYYALVNGVYYGLKPKPDVAPVNGQPVEFLSYGVQVSLNKDKTYTYAQGAVDTYLQEDMSLVCLGTNGSFLVNPHTAPLANAYVVGSQEPYTSSTAATKIASLTPTLLLSCSPLFFKAEDGPLSHRVRQFGSSATTSNNTLVNRFISVAELQNDPALITLANRMQPNSWFSQGYSALIELIPAKGKAYFGVLSVASSYLSASKDDMSLVVPGSYNASKMYGLWVTSAGGSIMQIESDFSISVPVGIRVLDPNGFEYAAALGVIKKSAGDYQGVIKAFNNIGERAGTKAGNSIGRGLGKMFNAFSSAFS